MVNKGKARNCTYIFDDETDNIARNVSWKDVLNNDEHLKQMLTT